MATMAGQVAVVTGAGRGIGAATATLLAERGAKVVLAARSVDQIEATAAQIREAGGEALAVPCDVSDGDPCRALIAKAVEQFGAVDVLINNAGTLALGPLSELARADWDRMVAVNLTGVFLCTQAALGVMLPRKRGVIVNVASVSGVTGVEKLPGLVGYAATKGGVILFSEALAAELKGTGVRCVAVSPGSVNTEMLRSVAPEFAPQAMSPEAMAKVIAFLASDEASAVTMTNLPVWGT